MPVRNPQVQAGAVDSWEDSTLSGLTTTLSDQHTAVLEHAAHALQTLGGTMKKYRRSSYRGLWGTLMAAAAGALVLSASPALAASATVSTTVATGTIIVSFDGSTGYSGAGALAVSACGNADSSGNPLPASAEGDRTYCFGVEALNITTDGATVGGLAVILSPVDGTNYTLNYTWPLANETIGAGAATCVANGNFPCRITANVAQLDQTIIESFAFDLVANVDTDADGVLDDNDNCIDDANADQADADADGIGDACEADSDGDGVIDDDDNCPATVNPDQLDADADGIGDACADDTDGDGVANSDDNCATDANPDQTDSDGDLAGDACDDDDDNDGVLDVADNCVLVANPDQTDLDGDGFGTECDVDGDEAAVTATTTPPSTTTAPPPTTTVATQVQGAQELAVTGVDEAPALAAALGLVLAGLGLTAISRTRRD